MTDVLFGINFHPQDGTLPDVPWGETVVAQVIQRHKPMKYIDAIGLLREAYDQSYGIFDYAKQAYIEKNSTNKELSRPLASVAMHYAEDYAGTSACKNLFTKFVDLKVGERFNISIMEFLEFPREITEMMFEVSERAMRQSNDATTDALNALRETTKK